MNILSIQSQVAYGHVGNAAAAFALQRLGHEVWALPTVQFSNHPAHGGYGGRVSPPALIGEITDGLEARGFLRSCDAILSGYLGSAENGAAVLRAVEQAKAANPDAVFLCDPVIGHAGRGVFVADGIPELFRDQILPQADIVAPNQFELAWLTGTTITSMADAIEAARRLFARGPGTVLCTSLRRDGKTATTETLLVEGPDAWVVETPNLPGEMFGAGDLFAALYLGYRLIDGNLPDALSRAVSATYAVLQATAHSGGGELRLIAAQDEMVSPTTIFPAQKVS